MENKKKAILAVSFGTSFHETREKTIDRIEADLAAAYPEYTLYRAWARQDDHREAEKAGWYCGSYGSGGCGTDDFRRRTGTDCAAHPYH